MVGFQDLFAHNMDEVLQAVFLLLDPGSLHVGRQVRSAERRSVVRRQ
jgi:hypothetical protein